MSEVPCVASKSAQGRQRSVEARGGELSLGLNRTARATIVEFVFTGWGSTPKQADRKKREEEHWALQAALKLDECWELVPREAPDFRVVSSVGEFGLEITECHIGKDSRGGSIKRAKEGRDLKLLDTARRKYERGSGVCLNLKYLGPVNHLAMEELVDALQAASLEDLDIFSRSAEITFASGKAWVHATKNPNWIIVRDRVGWVSRNGEFLQREIDKKARKLAKYREAYPDIRLLVVSNRILNSGKLLLEEGFRPDLRGFDAVYFFSYPDRVTPFYLTLS